MQEVELRGLRPLRRSRALTQGELAERVNTDQYNISKYENGKQSPRPPMIRKLADALGVEPEELFKEQPLAVPFAEPAPAEDVTALLRSRGGSELLVVDEEAFEARAAATDIPGLRALMAELAAGNRVAVEVLSEGGISREMRAALKDARNNFAPRVLILCNWAVRKEEEEVRELRAEADRLIAAEHEGANVPTR